MSLLNKVTCCSILREFSAEEQHDFFGICSQKTLHHIDTFYYAVYINEPDDIIELQKKSQLPDNLDYFIDYLRESKKEMNDSMEKRLDIGCGDLEMYLRSFPGYPYCVGIDESFDIFIAGYLPNASTPRILVQLRSRYLVVEGVCDAIGESFEYVKKFLQNFGLFPVKVRENRVDYAFHTNLIQNPNKYFSDRKLELHLKTDFEKYNKIGDIDGSNGTKLKTATLQLGQRDSNNLL